MDLPAKAVNGDTWNAGLQKVCYCYLFNNSESSLIFRILRTVGTAASLPLLKCVSSTTVFVRYSPARASRTYARLSLTKPTACHNGVAIFALRIASFRSFAPSSHPTFLFWRHRPH